MLRYNSPSAAGLPSILNEAVYGVLGKNKLFDERIPLQNIKLYFEKKRKESRLSKGLVVMPDALMSFKKTIDLVTSQGCSLVLVYIPTINLPDEINRDYVQFVEIMKNYTANNEKVIFLNYKEHYGNRYELFNDPEHLNRSGQKLISENLANDLIRLRLIKNK